MLDLRALDVPVVQAGMGAVSGDELAAAVSEAGGLGTIAGARAPIADELAAARALTGGPLAVNLLLPFLRLGDAEAAAAADAIVTFCAGHAGSRPGPGSIGAGTVEEALAAVGAGADAVIVQGVEAGGHVRGRTPLLELLERVLAAVRVPVLAAGGIVDAAVVEAVLDAGAVAAVAGTRFLLSDECRAHPDYKRRCQEADETVVTEPYRPRVAGRAAPRDPQRRDAALAARRQPRASLDTCGQPPHSAARPPHSAYGPKRRDREAALVLALPRPAAADRRRPGQPPGLRAPLRRDERGAHHRHPPCRRPRQSAHALARHGGQGVRGRANLIRLRRLVGGRGLSPENERRQQGGSPGRRRRLSGRLSWIGVTVQHLGRTVDPCRVSHRCGGELDRRGRASASPAEAPLSSPPSAGSLGAALGFGEGPQRRWVRP